MTLWHDPVIIWRVTCRIHMCDTTHSHAWHDSFIVHLCTGHGSATFLSRGRVCDVPCSHVWHDSFACVTWLMHHSSICVTWLSDMFVMRLCMWQASFHMCDTTHSHVWHDLFIIYPYVWHDSATYWSRGCVRDLPHAHVWHGAFFLQYTSDAMCVTRLILLFAECCSALQCVAECCRVLQCAAECGGVWHNSFPFQVMADNALDSDSDNNSNDGDECLMWRVCDVMGKVAMPLMSWESHVCVYTIYIYT